MLWFIWIVAAVLIGFWSLGSWALYALLTLDPRWVEDIEALVRQVPHAELIDRWIPGWQGLMTALLGLAQALLGWVSASAALVTAIAWGLGALLVLGAAGLTTLIVVLLRDKTPPAAGASAR